ncbi:S23 ribosomal protein [Candidatus Scalindua japonica]|uniref:S23 ribosomal protein n=1 Tax=Candidatus Scalindua japonica TaxID=1284222 RepID=A0A286U4G8_9BACT|nr:four helix bundle protein [Candidatus Scalindua japonica]GAX62961.1 S23 ribosomal protein [Candidatus Scalindua japonica]
MKITRFEDIESWQMARELTRQVYDVTKSHKFSKDFGLKDQICRASVSVMSNIAEGFDSGSRAEFARFLSYAQRSCSEVQSQLYVALDQHYLAIKTFDEVYMLTGNASSKIGAFIKYLKQQKTKTQ